VIALSRSESKRKTLEGMGAALAVDPTDTQWRRRVKEFLGARRVDLAIDNIGGALFAELLDTLGMNGRVSVVGRLAGPVPSFNTAGLFFRRLRIGGVAVATYTPGESQEAWEKVLGLLAKTGARPVVDSVHAFGELRAAFARLEQGPMGKVLLAVGG
jgi:NADPH:quinone reductase